jgi:hypothetical protein
MKAQNDKPRIAVVTVARLFAMIALLSLLSIAAISNSAGSTERPIRPADELRIRKDIREIESSPSELKNLRHAFFLMRKKAKTCTDPDAKTDYDCWAAYHNNFDLYGCRHNTDLFMPWHRYHLVEFEKALRASDPDHPERVAEVTLPYWNWSQKPSGRFFPKSIEQKELLPGEYYPEDCPDPTRPCINPLWADGRRTTTECQSIKPECIREAVNLPTWRDFGGGERSSEPSDFELQAHNFMHSRYIDGLMRNPTTASQDPIYWFFHAYIDNVWDQWQVAHQTDPCNVSNVPNPSRALRIGDWPPNTVQFRAVVCTKTLGYKYSPGPVSVAALPSCPAPRAGCTAVNPETLISSRAFTVADDFTRAEIKLSDVSIPADFSYDASILIHPASVSYKLGDAAFIDKYVATYFAVWKHGGHLTRHAGAGGTAQSATMEVALDVTAKLRSLLASSNSKDFAATIVFTPTSQKEHASRLAFGKDFRFTDASLIVGGVGPSRVTRIWPHR